MSQPNMDEQLVEDIIESLADAHRELTRMKPDYGLRLLVRLINNEFDLGPDESAAAPV